MIFATFHDPNAIIEAELGDQGEESRTIKGVAVPWNQIGVVADGRKVKFLPNSLDAAARPIVSLGHGGAAVGRVTANTASDAGMSTVVKVSKVPDGDNALVLASDGVLGMFSVGAEPVEFTYDGDVMVIAQADWRHLALLPEGAFTDAVVTSVAASQHKGDTNMTTELLDGTSPAVGAAAEPPSLVASAPQQPQGPTPVPLTAVRPQEPLTLARVAGLIASANRGEITADAVRTTLNAALANITSTNIGAIVAPAYRSEITAIVDHGTPLVQVLNSSPLPAGGMTIEFPEWTTPPTVGQQTTEKTAITSTAAVMNLRSVPIITIAGGNDISLQAVERSSPSFLEAYLRAMAVDFGRKCEAYVLAQLQATAVVATPGANFLANVQALLAALDPAVTPPGGLFVGMSYDVALPLISVTQQNGPAFWNGSINFGSMLPTVDTNTGVTLFVDANLPAKTMIAGARNGATWHQQGPADVRVVDVSLLGLDVGVYGYAVLTKEYPAAFSKMTLP